MQSVTAHMPLLTATSTFGLGRRRWSSPQQCYLYCLRTVPSLMKVVYYYVKFCEICDFRHIFKRNSFHRGSLRLYIFLQTSLFTASRTLMRSEFGDLQVLLSAGTFYVALCRESSVRVPDVSCSPG